ncbi:MAG: M48 family metalloprotease [Armatimonadetes bacterium]|nr:M48 family metalloprotease [Armatimonadota bacterium]
MALPLRILAQALIVTAIAALPAAAAAPGQDDEEIRLGRQYGAQLEQQHRLLADAAAAARVQRIGAEVAAVSGRPNLPYAFKVLDSEYPNAVALPGGIVYVTRGMLQFVRTDHELAAVLAQEVAHVVRRHTMQMLRRHGQAQFITLVSGVVTGKLEMVTGSRRASIGYLSAYPRDLEKEADLLAVSILQRTRYTPVALLTLMERLAREEMMSAQSDPGLFTDYPKASERVAYIEVELKRLRIPILRRPAAGYLQIAVRAVAERGREAGELLVDGHPVMRLPTLPGIRGIDRARVVAARLDRVFNEEIMPFEISAREIPEGWGIFVRQALIVTITPVGAALAGSTPQALAQQIRGRLMGAMQDSARRRRFQ